MPSLSYFLKNIDSSCQNINNLEFLAPGIFTNSIVTKPDITELIKDATVPELSLYRVVRPIDEEEEPGKLVRVDGKRYYVEDNEDFIHESSNKSRRTAVSVPLLESDDARSESRSAPGSSGGDSSPVKGTSVEASKIYRSLMDLLGKLPDTNEELVNEIRNMKQQHDYLTNEMSQLQSEYDELQKLLTTHNDYGVDAENDIDRELKKVEDEVAELQKQVSEKEANASSAQPIL